MRYPKLGYTYPPRDTRKDIGGVRCYDYRMCNTKYVIHPIAGLSGNFYVVQVSRTSKSIVNIFRLLYHHTGSPDSYSLYERSPHTLEWSGRVMRDFPNNRTRKSQDSETGASIITVFRATSRHYVIMTEKRREKCI